MYEIKIIGLKMFSFIVDEFVEKNKVNLKSVVVILICFVLVVLSYEYCFGKGKEYLEIENKMLIKEEDKIYKDL